MAFGGHASDFRKFDYGNAVQTGQQIKYNRMRNQALGIDMQEREDLVRKRAEAQEIRSTIQRMPEAIAEMDRQGLYDQADQLRDNYVRQVKGGVEVAVLLAEGLDESNYEQTRQDMLAAGAITPDMWPEDYSEDWWAKRVKREKNDLEVLTRQWAEDGVTMSQDLVSDSFGHISWKGEPYEEAADVKARTGGGGGFEYKASDDNAMGKQAERLFGGFYHPETGQFSGLSPEKAREVQAVHTAATELYAAGQGRITHAQAVREAAKRLRITIEDPSDALVTDPAGILPRGGQAVPPPAQQPRQ